MDNAHLNREPGQADAAVDPSRWEDDPFWGAPTELVLLAIVAAVLGPLAAALAFAV